MFSFEKKIQEGHHKPSILLCFHEKVVCAICHRCGTDGTPQVCCHREVPFRCHCFCFLWRELVMHGQMPPPGRRNDFGWKIMPTCPWLLISLNICYVQSDQVKERLCNLKTQCVLKWAYHICTVSMKGKNGSYKKNHKTMVKS
jgi:hypothetical protein